MKVNDVPLHSSPAVQDGSSSIVAPDGQECNWQCYLDRYPDLQKALGPNNTAQAEKHWINSGETEGRICTCRESDMMVLDNGEVKLGVDLLRGGSISYFGPSGSDLNLVNAFDLGRLIQMSYYSGPEFYNPDGKCNKLFRGQEWGWNPIGAGDLQHNAGEITTRWSNATDAHVVTIPMQWACKNVPCECEFEQRVTLAGAGARIDATLHNHRSDPTIYPARDQELPAVYSNGPYYRIITTEGGSLKEWEAGFNSSAAFPWLPGRFTADEHWAALVDEDGFGMGVVQLATTEFIGGFSGEKGQGGTFDAPSGYIAPVKRIQLPPQGRHDYTFYLVLGNIESIRAYAQQLKESE